MSLSLIFTHHGPYKLMLVLLVQVQSSLLELNTKQCFPTSDMQQVTRRA